MKYSDPTVGSEYFKVVGGGQVPHEHTIVYGRNKDFVRSNVDYLTLHGYGDPGPSNNNEDDAADAYYEWNRVITGISSEHNVVIRPLLSGVNSPSSYPDGYLYSTAEYTFPESPTLNVDNGYIWINAQRMVIRADDTDDDYFIHFTADGNRALVHRIANPGDPDVLKQRLILERQVGFYTNDSTKRSFKIDNTPRLIIADHKIPRPTQYGGNTYEARKDNAYIACSNFADSFTSSVNVKDGDITVSYYTFLRSAAFTPNNFDLGFGAGDYQSYYSSKELMMVPLETSVTLDLRTDNYRTATRDLERTMDNMLKINTAYEQESDLIINRVPPRSFRLEEDFSYRILASDTKLYGELFDAWMTYPTSQFMDLDTRHNEIHKLIEYNDQVYAIQDDGIALISIYPRLQTSASDGEALQLGEGDLLDDYFYLSTTYGSSLQFSVVKSMAGVYVVDNYRQAILKIGPKGIVPISDMNMLKSYLIPLKWDTLAVDNPYINQGIVAGHNEDNAEVLFTILQKYATEAQNDKEVVIDNRTLAFNEFADGFTGFYSYHPVMYQFVNGQLHTSEDGRTIWNHVVGNYCNYYGTVHKASVTFKMAPSGLMSNIFNTLMYQSQVTVDDVDLPTETITAIEAYNDYQTTGLTTVTAGVEAKRKYREWRVNLPREAGTRNRMRGAWIYCRLEFDPTGNKRLILHDVILDFTPFPASFV